MPDLYDLTETISFDIAGKSGVRIVPLEGGTRWCLHWTDYVVNEWTFEHDLLSVVLARAAALVRCGEADFDRFFATDDVTFADAAVAFLDSQVTQLDAERTWHGGPAKPKVEHIGGSDPGAQWRLWIPPTSIWCYEGATLDGALLGCWGNTYWPSHAEACEFLGQAILEGKVPDA